MVPTLTSVSVSQLFLVRLYRGLTFRRYSPVGYNSGFGVRLPQEAHEINVIVPFQQISEDTIDACCRWPPGRNPNNTIHVDDVAGAAWACAEWMAPLGRKTADTEAGEEIFFHNDKKKVKEVEGMPPHDQKLVAPLFNLVNEPIQLLSLS